MEHLVKIDLTISSYERQTELRGVNNKLSDVQYLDEWLLRNGKYLK